MASDDVKNNDTNQRKSSAGPTQKKSQTDFDLKKTKDTGAGVANAENLVTQIQNVGGAGMAGTDFQSQESFHAQERIGRMQATNEVLTSDEIAMKKALRGGFTLLAQNDMSKGQILKAATNNPQMMAMLDSLIEESAGKNRDAVFSRTMANWVKIVNATSQEGGEPVDMQDALKFFAPHALKAAESTYLESRKTTKDMLDKGLAHMREIQPPEYYDERPEDAQLAFAAATQMAGAIASGAMAASGEGRAASATSVGTAQAFETMGREMQKQKQVEQKLNSKLYASYADAVGKTNEQIKDMVNNSIKELGKTDREMLKQTIKAWEDRYNDWAKKEIEDTKRYSEEIARRKGMSSDEYRRAKIRIENQKLKLKKLKEAGDLTSKVIIKNGLEADYSVTYGDPNVAVQAKRYEKELPQLIRTLNADDKKAVINTGNVYDAFYRTARNQELTPELRRNLETASQYFHEKYQIDGEVLASTAKEDMLEFAEVLDGRVYSKEEIAEQLNGNFVKMDSLELDTSNAMKGMGAVALTKNSNQVSKQIGAGSTRLTTEQTSKISIQQKREDRAAVKSVFNQYEEINKMTTGTFWETSIESLLKIIEGEDFDQGVKDRLRNLADAGNREAEKLLTQIREE